jgi:hypothetical protein
MHMYLSAVRILRVCVLFSFHTSLGSTSIRITFAYAALAIDFLSLVAQQISAELIQVSAVEFF